MAAATLRRIQWNDATKAAWELLVSVFTTPVLKVSSMTGKPSNGNKYRQSGGGVRPALDQEKLGDVIGKCACIFLLTMHVPKAELSVSGRRTRTHRSGAVFSAPHEPGWGPAPQAGVGPRSSNRAWAPLLKPGWGPASQSSGPAAERGREETFFFIFVSGYGIPAERFYGSRPVPPHSHRCRGPTSLPDRDWTSLCSPRQKYLTNKNLNLSSRQDSVP